MNTSLVRVGICAVFLTAGFVARVAVLRADETSDIEKLDREVQQVERSLASPVAGKREYVDASISLQSLLVKANAMIRTDDDTDSASPLHKVLDRIIKAQKSVKARLPSGKNDLSVRTGLPVPEYDEDKLLGQLAAKLQAAQIAFAGHLSTSPDDAAGTQKLLHALVLAQENLAWEAGWPFFPDEVEAFKKADNLLTSDVYRARRARGIEKINRRLAYDAKRVGRKAPREFVIHAPEDSAQVADIAKALAESRGPAAAKSWMKGSRTFDAKERNALLGIRR